MRFAAWRWGSVLRASGVPTKEYTWQGTLLKPRIEFDGTKRTLATWLPTASCRKRRRRSSSAIQWTSEWRLSRERSVISTPAQQSEAAFFLW